jgi:hypothetical protein
MQSRSGVGEHVRRGAQQLSPFVCGHPQQGTGGDMLHVAVREFATRGKLIIGVGCQKMGQGVPRRA